ncbi:hypothetical protein FPRO04_10270 [Fusarium proliferatum]|nr:hypothetical protein FPRO04_10270 [Fusarium proliferatum]
MSRQGLSYFDIVPQWQTSVLSQQGTGISESLKSTKIIEVTDESDEDSCCEKGTPVIDKKLTASRQALKDKRITQREMNKLEGRLNRITILYTLLFCINIAISGVIVLKLIKSSD